MNFCDKLNEYIKTLECTAQNISEFSGLSAATLSRYRSGERTPEINSEAFENICKAIAVIAEKKHLHTITVGSVTKDFMKCSNMTLINKEQLMQNFNTLVSVLNINISKLCHHTNYDASTIFRFRNGSRQPADPIRFASNVADYVSKEMNSTTELKIISELLNSSVQELSDESVRFDKIRTWLTGSQFKQKNNISDFLKKLNEFDLNKYIQAIRFDEMKVPTVPFQLPTSKTYSGIKEMMDSELDFLKATVLSKSNTPVIMYSDMPMAKMAKDPEFPKKWMFGMAMMLKKGLHLNQIHNLDRSFDDMMLGLESWIPMYMTGQISPFYLKDVQNNVFLHLLKVSGAAALSGEAITGHHESGRYHMTKSKDEVKYYYKRAQDLLKNSFPLMKIYRKDSAENLNTFLLSDAHTPGKRKNILSTLPIYTLDKEYLKQFLDKRQIPKTKIKEILNFAEYKKQNTELILKSGTIEDDVPLLTKEEFNRSPITLCLSEMFHGAEIPYNYNEYLDHIKQSETFENTHTNYTFKKTPAHTFSNLQITIHEGEWAMVSKNLSPSIHFVIHHPTLRNAIENFIPPVVEKDTI